MEQVLTVLTVSDISMCFPFFLLLALLLSALHAQGRSPLDMFDMTNPRRSFYKSASFRSWNMDTMTSAAQRAFLGKNIGGAYTSAFRLVNNRAPWLALPFMKHGYIVESVASQAAAKKSTRGEDKGGDTPPSAGGAPARFVWGKNDTAKVERLETVADKKGNLKTQWVRYDDITKAGLGFARALTPVEVRQLRRDSFNNRLSSLNYAKGSDFVPQSSTEAGGVRMSVTGIQGYGGGARGQMIRGQFGAIGTAEKGAMWFGMKRAAVSLGVKDAFGTLLLRNVVFRGGVKEAEARGKTDRREQYRHIQEKYYERKSANPLLAFPKTWIGILVNTEREKHDLKKAQAFYDIYSPHKKSALGSGGLMTPGERAQILAATNTALFDLENDTHNLSQISSPVYVSALWKGMTFFSLGVFTLPITIYSGARVAGTMYSASKSPEKSRDLAQRAMNPLERFYEDKNTLRRSTELQLERESGQRAFLQREAATRETAKTLLAAAAVPPTVASLDSEISKLGGTQEEQVRGLRLIRDHLVQVEAAGWKGALAIEQVSKRVDTEARGLERKIQIQTDKVSDIRVKEEMLLKDLVSLQPLYLDAIRQFNRYSAEARAAEAEREPPTLSQRIRNAPVLSSAYGLAAAYGEFWGGYFGHFPAAVGSVLLRKPSYEGATRELHAADGIRAKRADFLAEAAEAASKQYANIFAAVSTPEHTVGAFTALENERRTMQLTPKAEAAFKSVEREVALLQATAEATGKGGVNKRISPAEFTRQCAAARQAVESLQASAPDSPEFNNALNRLSKGIGDYEKIGTVQKLREQDLETANADYNNLAVKRRIEHGEYARRKADDATQRLRAVDTAVERLEKARGYAQGPYEHEALNQTTHMWREGAAAKLKEQHDSFAGLINNSKEEGRLEKKKKKQQDDFAEIWRRYEHAEERKALLSKDEDPSKQVDLVYANMDFDRARQAVDAAKREHLRLEEELGHVQEAIRREEEKPVTGWIGRRISGALAGRHFDYEKALNVMGTKPDDVQRIGAYQKVDEKDPILRISRGITDGFEKRMAGYVAHETGRVAEYREQRLNRLGDARGRGYTIRDRDEENRREDE